MACQMVWMELCALRWCWSNPCSSSHPAPSRARPLTALLELALKAAAGEGVAAAGRETQQKAQPIKLQPCKVAVLFCQLTVSTRFPYQVRPACLWHVAPSIALAHSHTLCLPSMCRTLRTHRVHLRDGKVEVALLDVGVALRPHLADGGLVVGALQAGWGAGRGAGIMPLPLDACSNARTTSIPRLGMGPKTCSTCSMSSGIARPGIHARGRSLRRLDSRRVRCPPWHHPQPRTSVEQA